MPYKTSEKHREYSRKYNYTPKGIAIRKRYEESQHGREKRKAYANSERGYLIDTINGIFSRARKNNKRKKWIPECTKEEIYDELMLYIQDRGRICEYCEKLWTYIRLIGEYKTKRKKRGLSVDTNFSIDRLDSEKTYTKNNLVFCCIGCNMRKNQVLLSDIDNIQKVRQRRGLS